VIIRGRSGTWLCSGSGTGGETGLLSWRRFLASVEMCRSRAGLDPVFRVVVFVINGSCRSSVLGVACRVSPAGSAGQKGGAVQVGAGGGWPAARLSGLR